MQLPEINLDTITDPAARQLIGQLLNSIEAMHTELLSLRTENQLLRDENARLKGGSGKPDIKPTTPPPATDHSSEAERHTRTPRGKPKKNAFLVVTREQPCVIDPACLPPEAVRHGTSEVLVQDLLLTTEIIRFVREVWLLPSTSQAITAPLPDGYQGVFDPHIQALAALRGSWRGCGRAGATAAAGLRCTGDCGLPRADRDADCTAVAER